MSRVFIGSTSKDLADYRQAAIDVCLGLNMQPIAMEHFGAMDADAIQGSKAKLDEADVYVGIFGFRYGYIADGQTSSVTEIEFDYADERKISRLCFLADAKHPFPPEVMDVDHHAEMQALRDKVNAALIRAEFTDVNDLFYHLHRLYIEEASMETQKVFQQRRDAISELGCVYRVSGMTNFT